jgi:hypothetical protein
VKLRFWNYSHRYGAELDAPSYAIDTARVLAEAHQHGERPSHHQLARTLARIEPHEQNLADLRAKVATFKAMFRTHSAPVAGHAAQPQLSHSASKISGFVPEIAQLWCRTG